MADGDNLPTKVNAGNAPAHAGQSGTLVARGLEAIRNVSKQAVSRPSDADLEERFADAFDREDYETCLRIIRLLESRGSVAAEELYGELLCAAEASCVSFGDDEDDSKEVARAEKCHSCIRRAAELGDPLAQDLMSSIYCTGSWAREDDPENDPEAVKWTRMAAEQGRAGAQVNLGLMYYNGQKGVPQDYIEAMKWFQKAAEQNFLEILIQDW